MALLESAPIEADLRTAIKPLNWKAELLWATHLLGGILSIIARVSPNNSAVLNCMKQREEMIEGVGSSKLLFLSYEEVQAESERISAADIFENPAIPNHLGQRTIDLLNRRFDAGECRAAMYTLGIKDALAVSQQVAILQLSQRIWYKSEFNSLAIYKEIRTEQLNLLKRG